MIPVILVYCDGVEEDCPLQGEQAFPDHYGVQTKARAWEVAKAAGWKRRGRRHYCPHCAAQLKGAK